ncbi:Mce protein [Mycolicibacterium rhodesiae]|uniref:Mce protein n=1 Tax=Mycolicibacterium rhodesiae TaxID=36814 RepID=A0A1X0J228_MYCRH|nr:Mce protein [Mycolicibacterium rhodesiae]MCV7344698.1 Mce protein [Mycolicibacterium rhodesiae]ORB55832.1 Mce protein [Mycolicibacterium rhodesiae]
MEDQQPAAGDLTDAAPEATPEDEATEAEAESETETETETVEQAPAESPKRPNWLSRNKTALAVGVSAVVFVAGGAFAGAAVQPYLMDKATVDTKLAIARTAADAITTLWTYTPEDMDKLPDRSAKYLSGDFEDQYRKYVDAIVPTNKQAKVTNSTEVVGAAVESLTGSEATALVYTNTTSKSPLTKDIPATKYLSYRVQLTRDGSRWLVTKMTTVTSLDLTPKL